MEGSTCSRAFSKVWGGLKRGPRRAKRGQAKKADGGKQKPWSPSLARKWGSKVVG